MKRSSSARIAEVSRDRPPRQGGDFGTAGVLERRDMRHGRQAILIALALAGALAVSGQLATAAFAIPNDPGQTGVAGGWASDQWNFGAAPNGIDAVGAWSNSGAHPGAGVIVAVL